MRQSTSSASPDRSGFPVWTIPEFFSRFVPEYRSINHGRLIINLEWDRKYGREISKISERRASSRCEGYLESSEIARAKGKLRSKGEASIRLGNQKRGHGYSGERGDFCLVAGAVKKTEAVFFYRSLELIGGFAYDLCLLNALESRLGCNWETVSIFTCKAFIFALKGNSNEKLYPKLERIFAG